MNKGMRAQCKGNPSSPTFRKKEERSVVQHADGEITWSNARNWGDEEVLSTSTREDLNRQ